MPSGTPKPVGKVECPYCKAMMDAPDEETYFDEDEFPDFICKKCSRYFDVYAEVSIMFRAERKDDSNAEWQ